MSIAIASAQGHQRHLGRRGGAPRLHRRCRQAAGGDARPLDQAAGEQQHPPTSTMIGVTRLFHPAFLIEIDLVAIIEA
jgi:hypothetical protein